MAFSVLLAASTLIAPVGGPIDATGSHLAYSRPEGRGYRLVIDGRDPRVAPSRRPFDVDLGTDARGRLVAVYTRTVAGRRDVHWLDVGTGRERRVPVAARSGRDELAPSVSRGTVAFVARGRRRDRLFLGGLTGGRVVEQPGPSLPTGDGLQVEETELAGGVLAFTAAQTYLNDPDRGLGQLWFARVGRAPRLLARGVSSVNQGSAFFAPQVSSVWVSAGFGHVGDGGTYSRIVRVSPASGTEQRATAPDVPNADFQAGEAQRELQGLGLGARGAAYTSACAADSVNEPGTPPDCRLERTELRWR